MRATEITSTVVAGVLSKYANLYSDVNAASERIARAAGKFVGFFGDADAMLLSVPGRSEVCGNHTDHNNGKVLAAAIDRDIIAIASKNDDGVIRFYSEGYPLDTVELSLAPDKNNFKRYSSAALIAGVVDGFSKKGYTVGGFNVYSTSEVLKGSGISSSAAFEIMVGNALNHLYNGGKVDSKDIARIAQYAENEYFGKPSGLMDQMACAVGGFVYIDFGGKDAVVEPIDFPISDKGYSLCIVNTGGNHADLNEDYASVPGEMKAVARAFGKETLSEVGEGEFMVCMKALREGVGDRAILRAIHFIRENKRVTEAMYALKAGDVDAFLDAVTSSGNSSFKYLQNVYTTNNVSEQGLSLALALADGYLDGKSGACRVHGGGFAGTIQVFVKNEDLDGLVELMDSVFGRGAAMPLGIRSLGAIRIDLENKGEI